MKVTFSQTFLVLFQPQRPSYDDDFDSEVDEDEDENMLQMKRVTVNNKNNPPTKQSKTKDGSDEDTEEDSDFEDPDETEVPGGGKDLDTIFKITANPTSSKPEATAGKSSRHIIAFLTPPPNVNLLYRC